MRSFDVVELAKAVAMTAHAGQVDKSGEPYIGHPARVAHATAQETENPEVIAAAYLHDVVEDTPVDLTDLMRMGFPAETVKVVDLLTRRDHESHAEAVQRAAEHPGARLVKLCDVEDNSDPRRLERLDERTRARLHRKYIKARTVLLAHAVPPNPPPAPPRPAPTYETVEKGGTVVEASRSIRERIFGRASR